MKKILALIISFIIILGVFTGCGIQNENPGESSDSTSQTNAKPSDSERNTVVDELGRIVEIPENPQKILGLTSAVMEALFNIGITPIGKVEEYKIRSEGIKLTSVGMTNNLNIEKICELEPDFIIASSRYHASVKAELELAGCPVYFFDPDAVGDVSIVDLTPFIGNLLGKSDDGNAYKLAVEATANTLKEQISTKGDYKSGLIIKTGDTVTCAQRSSGYGALLIMLGIENIVPDNLPNAKKSPYVAYDVEQIINDNPDVIFVIAPGKDQESNKAVLQEIKADENWSQFDAVKNGNIFMMPFSVNPNRMNVEDMLNTTANLIINKK